MSIKSDRWIRQQATERAMITPFEPGQVSHAANIDVRLISFGTSSYGYDLRLAPEYKVFTPVHSVLVDPKHFDERVFEELTGDHCIIPPHGFVLARTIEWIRMPKDCIALVAAKSSYARCGIVVNFTVIEPEWEGEITLELSNTTPLPAKIYANEGIAQLLFFQSDEPCVTTYADRQGKYQGQRGVVPPRMKG
jgi:dCTP deaminase